MENTLENLLNDSQFLSQLESCKITSDIVGLFSANGLSLTEEDIASISHSLEIDSELEPSEMVSVAGGSIVSDVTTLLNNLLHHLKHGGGVGRHF